MNLRPLARGALLAGAAGVGVSALYVPHDVDLPAALPGDGHGRVRAFLRSAPMRGIGVVSYSFYLWHYAAIGQVARWWDGLPGGFGWVLWTAATFSLSLAIATASYWLVERPFMRLRTVVPGRRRAATPDAVQAAP